MLLRCARLHGHGHDPRRGLRGSSSTELRQLFTELRGRCRDSCANFMARIRTAGGALRRRCSQLGRRTFGGELLTDGGRTTTAAGRFRALRGPISLLMLCVQNEKNVQSASQFIDNCFKTRERQLPSGRSKSDYSTESSEIPLNGFLNSLGRAVFRSVRTARRIIRIL